MSPAPSITMITGDCREIMPGRGPFDMVFADPPYGDTSLKWDKRVENWHLLAAQCLKPTGSLWVFGSLRFFMAEGRRFKQAGLRYAQEIVWRKPNGTGLAADRFKRVHELVVQFYRQDAKWGRVYNDVQRAPALTRNESVRMRRPNRLGHMGQTGVVDYHDDGTRIVKSVIEMNSVRGGLHPTEKPVGLLELLIRTSCPPGGMVGDFFAGSGAVGEAAALTGRAYLGCEIDPRMADKARKRLASIPALPAREGSSDGRAHGPASPSNPHILGDATIEQPGPRR